MSATLVIRHGHARKNAGAETPTYRSWRAMVDRCTQPSHKDWPHYGGKGIGICVRWGSFINFLADMGERPEGTTLDRIDSNDDYAPANCRWADAATQARDSGRYNAEKTHCPQGHEYTPENMYVYADGRRHCKTCILARGRERRMKAAA